MITPTNPLQQKTGVPAEAPAKKAPAKPAGKDMTGKKRILLVDDHPIVRQGLAELIDAQKDLGVIGTASNMQTALDLIDKLIPDLVIVDISLSGNNGIELVKNIKVRHPKMLILMLSMHDESLYAVRSLRAGASGYIMKQEATDKVLTAIRQVLNGEIYLSEKMEKRMVSQLVGAGRTERTGNPIEDLTDRELEVFGLIGQGHGTRQIAEKLHLSIKTVESHRAHIKEKLNLKTATELVQHAIQWQES
ncbi:MAG TPA: response regulator transcription factor [Methylomirabilota bacterium]|nr:response regulator transcription factor [Methylomirabilota bacterium]